MLQRAQQRSRLLVLLSIVLIVLLSLNATGAQAQGGGDSDKEKPQLDIQVGDKYIDVIKALREQKLIPAGGKIALELPRSVIQAKREDFNFLVIGRNTSVKNMVLNFEMRAAAIEGEENGCGIYFRTTTNGFSLVMLTKDRHVLLAQFKADKNGKNKAVFTFDESIDDIAEKQEFDASDYALDDEQIHILTLIMVDENIQFFLNGLLVAEIDEAEAVKGGFATVLFNEQGNESLTECRYSNIWAWSFDR